MNGRRNALSRFVGAFAVVFLLSACWALATPISGVPDEPSHTVKAAAVVRGQLGGQPTTSDGGQDVLVRVPVWIGETQKLTCFAYHADITPSCWTYPYDDSRKLVEAATTAGNYNPVYYAIVGLPSLVFSGQVGFYSMRFTSAALSSLLIAAAMFLALARPNGRWVAGAIAVAVTPMVMFLNGSVNPNSLEFSAMLAFVVGLHTVVEARGRVGLVPLVVTTVSGALLANAKNDGLLWIALGTIAVIALSGARPFAEIFRRPAVLIATATLALSVLFALWWLVTNPAFGSKPFEGAGMPWWNGLLIMFDRTGDYASGLIGYFGWLDTPAPTTVLLLWEAACIALVAIAVFVLRGRGRVAVLGAVAALIVIPPALQAAVVMSNGLVWQGRYNLALFALLAVVTGLAVDTSGRSWTIRDLLFARVILLCLAVGHAYAFVWVLRRYVTGLSIDRSWFQMVTHAQWQPPGSWELLTVVFVLVAAVPVVGLWRVNWAAPGAAIPAG